MLPAIFKMLFVGKTTRTALAVASFVSACGEGRVDPEAVILLVPEGEWSEQQTEAISSAGDAWNDEFGTRLSLDPDGDGDYSVEVSMTDDGCMNDRFRRTHARAFMVPPEILVCPEIANDRVLLFESIRHELGHVLGIASHAREESAVMAPIATESRHWFHDEDRELFFTANPEMRVP
jgi:hypothetical protein